MPNNFQTALLYVLKNEGGFCQVADDHGGATNRGVTLESFAAWRQVNGLAAPTVDDLKAMTVSDCAAFYRWHDWAPLGLDACNSPVVATVLFDIGVLNGASTAAMAAQAIGSALSGQTLAADGKLGPKSWATINSCSESRFVRSLQRRQARRYLDICVKTPSQVQFYDGWLARTFAYSDLLQPSALAGA